MTAGMGVTPHTPPSWYFDVMQSTTWQWEAPSAPEQRRNSRQDLSIPGIYNRVRTWLEQSDANQVFIQPPQDLAAPETRFTAIDASVPEVSSLDGTRDTHGYDHEQSLPHEIEQLRLKLASLAVPHEGAVLKLCKRCGQSLAKRVNSGELSADEIMMALNPIDAATRSLLVNTHLIDRATSMIRRELLYGMHLAEQGGSNLVPRKIWKEMTAYLSNEDFAAQPGNVALFTLLLRTLPDAYRSLIESKHVFGATRAIVQSDEEFGMGAAKASALRAGKVASALGRLNEAEWAELSESMATYLGSLTCAPEERYRMRRMWLFIQAHSSRTTHEAFTSLYQSFVGSETQATRKANTWLLLLARLTATGSITRENRTDLYNNFSQTSHQWVKVLGLLHASEHQQTRLAEMYSLMTTMSAKNSFLQTVSTTSLTAADIDAIRDLAISSNDALFALQAFEAIYASADEDAAAKQWKWATWAPYLKTITQDKKLDSKIMYMIKRTAPAQAKADLDANMSFLASMAKLYISSPSLSERQKLRRLQWCAARQREISGAVSFDMLKMIAESVTDDLSKGMYGRTERLEWLLRLIDEMLGAEQATKSLKALQGWRRMISRASGRT
ncbi:hypothetical protein K4F52_007386 [Lecanicillium sp. MT-2017a]|nr:hypothetical protein K4F52_007386 [Lecanicillium sp. MT-2017a]